MQLLYATMCNILPWWNEDAWVLNDGFSEFPLCCWGPALFFKGESWAWNCMDLLIVGSAIFETLVQVPYRHGHPVIARSILELSPMSIHEPMKHMSCARSHWLWYTQTLGCIWICLNSVQPWKSLQFKGWRADSQGRSPQHWCGEFVEFAGHPNRSHHPAGAPHAHCADHTMLGTWQTLRLPLLPLLCPQLPSNRAISELPWKKSREGSEQFLGILRGHRGARRQLWQAMNLW